VSLLLLCMKNTCSSRWLLLATSNAPQVARKRRRSSLDHESEDQLSAKKSRAEESIATETDKASETSGREESPTRVNETEEVKEVTKGVKEVELEDQGSRNALSLSKEHASPETQLGKEPELAVELNGESENSPPETDQKRDEDAEPNDTEALAPPQSESTSDATSSTEHQAKAPPPDRDSISKDDSSETAAEEGTPLAKDEHTTEERG
jgi:hypothetical protein